MQRTDFFPFPGVPLEEMDALFSKSTHLVVWAQLRGRPLVNTRDNFGNDSRRNSLKKAEEAVAQVP